MAAACVQRSKRRQLPRSPPCPAAEAARRLSAGAHGPTRRACGGLVVQCIACLHAVRGVLQEPGRPLAADRTGHHAERHIACSMWWKEHGRGGGQAALEAGSGVVTARAPGCTSQQRQRPCSGDSASSHRARSRRDGGSRRSACRVRRSAAHQLSWWCWGGPAQATPAAPPPPLPRAPTDPSSGRPGWGPGGAPRRFAHGTSQAHSRQPAEAVRASEVVGGGMHACMHTMRREHRFQPSRHGSVALNKRPQAPAQLAA